MLITLGMAPEVVVVIQNENLFIGPVLLTIKNSRGEAAQARADNHEIIVFTSFPHVISAETAAPRMLVRHRVGAWVAPPEAGQGRGVGRRI